MLDINKDAVLIIVVHNATEDYMLNQLTTDGGDGYWSVVGRCTSIPLLVDGRDISQSPVGWNRSSCYGLLEDES